MTKTVITTVGTSIFENYNENKKGKDSNFNANYIKLKKGDYSFSEWNKHAPRLDRLHKIIISSFDRSKKNASAEINSILAIANKENCDLDIQLVASDTILSTLSAQLIKEWFGDNFITQNGKRISISNEVKTLEGLQVKDIKAFKKNGLPNLLKVFKEYVTDKSFAPLVILNITGGYKAFIPYLTILGQLNYVKICYLFEGTENIITFPQSPINLDFSIFKEFYPIFQELYTDSIEGKWATYQMNNNLPIFIENFIDIEDFGKDQLFELNAIGRYYFEIFENYFLIQINKGAKIFSEKEGNRQQIITALKELYQRLNDLIHNNQGISNSKEFNKYINSLGDKSDLRHGKNPSKNIFIFKSTNVGQVRLVYAVKLDNNYLSITLYDYIQGSFNHSTYINEFQKKYKFKSQYDFVRIPIRKN